ncbi:hypothetical protein [Stutzerimonas kunmingensis]|uniref:hypothetical protein n=1 Tax=Stutzerimonas kunmingensis TaxID=1211807 RepID=UPI0035E41FCC
MLRQLRALLANSSYRISGTAAFLHSIDAALSQQAEPTDTYTAVEMATAAAQGFRDGQAAVEQAAAQDEREFDMQDQLVAISKAVADGDQVRAQHLLSTAIKYTRPAQTEQQPVAWADAQQLKALVRDCSASCAVWNSQGRSRVPLYAVPIAQTAPQGKFRMGDLVKKSTGSEWEGRVVGWYSTEQTKEGYAVESSAHRNSVQIYPATALEAVE